MAEPFMDSPTLPNLIHAGVPKSASATVNAIATAHPEIFLPRTKEPNFFIQDEQFSQGADWYGATYYADAGEMRIVGDMSIGYATGFGFDVPERIAQTIGTDLKVLLTFREPAARAFSQYSMARDKGQFETLDFPAAVERALAVGGRLTDIDRRRVRSGTYYQSADDMDLFRWCMYVEPGHYADIFDRWCQTFGTQNILVLITEDIAANLQEQADKLFRFLGLEPVPVQPDLRRNEATTLRYPAVKRLFNRLYAVGPIRRRLDAPAAMQLRRRLRKRFLTRNYVPNTDRQPPDRAAVLKMQAHYAPQVHKLEAALGRNLDIWRQPDASNEARA
ncbi:MAG: sulfotransferase domain-containing protein [Devosia sp.]